MSEVLAEAQIFYGLSEAVSELGILGCQAGEINQGTGNRRSWPAMCGNVRGG